MSSSPVGAVAERGAKQTTNGNSNEALLSVNNLVMHFPLTQGIIFQRKVGAV